MAYYGTIGGDRWPHDPECRGCRQPILKGEETTRVDFKNFREETRGLSGVYHRECSRPYASLARVINMNPFGGF